MCDSHRVGGVPTLLLWENFPRDSLSAGVSVPSISPGYGDIKYRIVSLSSHALLPSSSNGKGRMPLRPVDGQLALTRGWLVIDFPPVLSLAFPTCTLSYMRAELFLLTYSTPSL